MRSRLNIEALKRGPLKIFTSYSHQDEKYREAICKHLSIYEKQQIITIWFDRKLHPGANWDQNIKDELNDSDIILVLISIDFVASSYCWDIELSRAIQRHSAGEAVIVPIFVRPIEGLNYTPLQHLNYIPRNKPLSKYKSLDEGCTVVISELERVISNFSFIIEDSAKRFIWWGLTFKDPIEQFNTERIKNITIKLREITDDNSIACIDRYSGSTTLVFQSEPKTYDIIDDAFSDSSLSNHLDEIVVDITRPLGARLKIRSLQSDNSVDHVVYENFKEPQLLQSKLRFPPIIHGIVYSVDNPIAPGFSLYTDHHTEFSEKEVIDLQSRLGRYMNTFLAVESKYHHVDLSPTEEYAGLPKPLRNTEVGRDLLLSDLRLKQVATQLLHPSTHSGAAFWHQLQIHGLMAHPDLTTVLRLWITPSKATLEEQQIDERTMSANIKGFSLKVECEEDYLRIEKKGSAEHDKLLSIFKETILPKVQEQVSAGSAFGLLKAAVFRRDHLALVPKTS